MEVGLRLAKAQTRKVSITRPIAMCKGDRGTILNIVDMISILAGSIILLGLFIPIAYEGIKTKNTSKHSRVSVLNNKWQKVTVSVR